MARAPAPPRASAPARTQPFDACGPSCVEFSGHLNTGRSVGWDARRQGSFALQQRKVRGRDRHRRALGVESSDGTDAIAFARVRKRDVLPTTPYGDKAQQASKYRVVRGAHPDARVKHNEPASGHLSAPTAFAREKNLGHSVAGCSYSAAHTVRHVGTLEVLAVGHPQRRAVLREPATQHAYYYMCS